MWRCRAADLTLLRAGGVYTDFYTTNFPTGAIRGAFTRYTFAIPTAAANRVQYGVAVMVNEAMGSSLAFDEVIVDLAQLSAADQLKAYEELSGRTLYSQSVQVLDTMSGFQNSLFSHANDTPADLGTFSLFARGGYTVGKRDDTRDQAGASLSRPYILGGIDTTFLPNASAGSTLTLAIAVGVVTMMFTWVDAALAVTLILLRAVESEAQTVGFIVK